LAHYGQVLAPSIIGSLIGAVFALGLSRGYIELLREGRRREELLRSLELAHRNLLDLQDELALTQRHAGELQERTRVSRDIHDTIAQSISSIRLIAHAEAERTADGHAGQVLVQVEDLAAQSSRDVRRIIAALAPAELEDGALTAAIRRLLTRFEQDTDPSVGRVEVDDTLPSSARRGGSGAAADRSVCFGQRPSAFAGESSDGQPHGCRKAPSAWTSSMTAWAWQSRRSGQRSSDSGFGLDFIAVTHA
jgi:hypothetical protein